MENKNDTDKENKKQKSSPEQDSSGVKKAETAADVEDFNPAVSTKVVRETIKQKPVNKKKLLRRTIITVVMAAVFGLIASLTFLLLEPVISNWLYPEKQQTGNNSVTFQEETKEMLPQQMYITDKQMEEQSEQKTDTEDIQDALSQLKLSEENYKQLYDSLKTVSDEAQKSLVTVTDVTSDVDWFNNTYESKADTTGVIIADTSSTLLILVDDKTLKTAEHIEVTFEDGTQHDSQFVQQDTTTGLSIISVDDSSITDDTRETISIAEIGSTGSSSEGTPVIAKGSLSGEGKAVNYGIITSEGHVLDLPDSEYRLVTTNMYGAAGDSGILFNTDGRMIGIIDNSHNTDAGKNLISAYMLSDLRDLIQDMSNERDRVYLGILATDVPKQVAEDQKIPEGIYITSIDMDSPAMKSGLQSGDIIISADGKDMDTYADLLTYINEKNPDDTVRLRAMRQSGNEYVKVPAEAVLSKLK